MRILVATDFSESADAALDWAVDLAVRYRAELTLIHVFAVPGVAFIDGVLPPSPVDVAEIARDASDRIEVLAERCRLRAAGRLAGVKGLVRAGEAVTGILEAARELGADLVVMGTHGRTGLAHLVLGSVAERVVRECPCPVLTVRSGPAAHVPAPQAG